MSADGPRVGADVWLAREGNVVTFPHLREALGEDQAARGSRVPPSTGGALEELLFGFGEEERYHPRDDRLPGVRAA